MATVRPMCGIYGYVGEAPKGRLGLRVHRGLLGRAAYLAGTRGPHAHGWAEPTPSSSKVWKVVRRAGSSMADPDCADSLARMVIGHSRLGTGHNPFVTSEAQPLVVADRLVVAHNGVVHHLEDLAYAERMTTGTDSEAIGIAVLDELAAGRRLDDAVDLAIDHCDLDSPFALIVADLETGNYAAHAGGQPLFAYKGSRGTYLCSRRMDSAKRLPEGTTFLWSVPA